MTSKECLKRIDAGKYSTQKEHKELLEVVKQDLDRLEKIDKAVQILKNKVKIELYHTPRSRDYYWWIGGRVVTLSKEEFNLLKEVFE